MDIVSIKRNSPSRYQMLFNCPSNVLAETCLMLVFAVQKVFVLRSLAFQFLSPNLSAKLLSDAAFNVSWYHVVSYEDSSVSCTFKRKNISRECSGCSCLWGHCWRIHFRPDVILPFCAFINCKSWWFRWLFYVVCCVMCRLGERWISRLSALRFLRLTHVDYIAKDSHF